MKRQSITSMTRWKNEKNNEDTPQESRRSRDTGVSQSRQACVTGAHHRCQTCFTGKSLWFERLSKEQLSSASNYRKQIPHRYRTAAVWINTIHFSSVEK